MIRLDNQVALITGAARGLGLEYAKLFLERGAKVVMQDYGVNKDGSGNDSQLISDIAQSLPYNPENILPVSVNLNNRESCLQLADTLIERFGKIDILIHNAGWVAYQQIENLEPDFLQRAIDVSILIPTWLTHALFPIMKKQRYGRVVLNTSDRAIYTEYAQKGLVPYAMGKMAQIGLMNILALEGNEYNIHINTVSPVAKTRMWGRGDSANEPEDLKPSQIAQGVLYLASDLCNESGYILRAANGQFYAAKWMERDGVDYPYDLNAYPYDNAEDIAKNWDKIANTIKF